LRWPSPARGAVVCEQSLATEAGLAALEAGGNAVDAAVTTAFALAVVYPQAGNLGGGGFAIYVPHDPSGEALALDFRETSPAALRSEDFLVDGEVDRQLALASPLAAGVPGSPAGLIALHDRLGRLSRAAVMGPAIELAQDGFIVDAWLEGALGSTSSRRRLEANPAAKSRFYPGGVPLKEGSLLVQPDLARTLERILAEGPQGFYRGSVAQALVAAVQAGGGRMLLEDLKAYVPVWRTPVRGWFRGLEVISMPPPSSGGLVLLQALAVLDGFPLDGDRARTLARGDGTGAGLGPLATHWWIEAIRGAFADRAQHMGDPDFHPVPVEALLSSTHVADRRTAIGERARPELLPMEAPPEGGGETTHLSVIDREGNAVSLTTTLNTSFGCGVLVPGAGFLLNNELDDFAIKAGSPNAYGLVGGKANALGPGKRPLSSMTPTVIRNGGSAVTMVIGAPGGSSIITAVLQVILRTEVYGQSLFEAVAAPRLHQQWSPVTTRFEEGWDPVLLQGLKDRGHAIDVKPATMASVQAIRLEIGGEPEVVSDPRRGGVGGVFPPID